MADGFNLASAFAAFESPEEVVARRRSENIERLQANRRSQTSRERAAAQFGSSLAELAEAISGGSREEKAARSLQTAFTRIARSPSAGSDTAEQERIQAEQARIAETGAQAEARYVAQGLSEDEAKLRAFDDVISEATMPEVARSLIVMRGQLATEMAEKRKNLAVLKAEAVDEEIDRDIKRSQLAQEKAEEETMGLEFLELQRADRQLAAQGLSPENPQRQQIQARINKLTFQKPPPPGDGVETRRFRKEMADAAINQIKNVDRANQVREMLAEDPNIRTSVGAVAGFANNLIQDIEALPGGKGLAEVFREARDAIGWEEFGNDSQLARSLFNLIALEQTDALIKGVPSNIDLAKVTTVIGETLKNPETISAVLDNLVETQASSIDERAFLLDMQGDSIYQNWQSRYNDKWVQPRAEAAKKAEGQAAAEDATEEEFDLVFDVKTGQLVPANQLQE